MKQVPFANCIPVRGQSRSVICDLQRQQVKLIPNSLFEILTQHSGKTIAEVKQAYDNKFDETIDEYFAFLLAHEFIFETENPEWFPPLSMEWDEPFPITNMIIDRNNSSNYDMCDLMTQIDDINCKHIQIRFFDAVKLSFVTSILNHIAQLEAIILSIDIILPSSQETTLESLQTIINEHPRVAIFYVHSAKEYQYHESKVGNLGHILYTSQKITNKNHCGIIDQSLFVSNIKTFTEGQHHNTCLNRKLSIDVNGDIKNCPSTTTVFGNIKDTTLQEVLKHDKLEELWHITKDQIDVCKTCEFRYVCTDCRGYIENPEDIYSKPLKCGYNPATTEWEEWSTNPLKQKAIEFYELKEIRTN